MKTKRYCRTDNQQDCPAVCIDSVDGFREESSAPRRSFLDREVPGWNSGSADQLIAGWPVDYWQK